jgi:hypothetical protein
MGGNGTYQDQDQDHLGSDRGRVWDRTRETALDFSCQRPCLLRSDMTLVEEQMDTRWQMRRAGRCRLVRVSSAAHVPLDDTI